MPYKDRTKQLLSQKEATATLRRERRQLLLAGKACARCGYLDTRALEFHHRLGEIKKANVTNLLTNSLDKLLEEVVKCDVICANCHAIEHSTR